jgi:VIT1/CCC1 family predicted Fe2+/Mn2+ transporter
MEETAIRALIANGGFAVLAGFAIFILWKMHTAHADDLKASAGREKLLTDRVLDVSLSVQSALVSNTSAITGLASETAGARAILHNIANSMADHEHRIYGLEKKP